MGSMFNKKSSAKNTAITPIQINGVTVTNVEDAVAKLTQQLGSITVGENGEVTTVINAKPYDSGNYSVAYTLNSAQKITKEVYSGDINRIRTMEYVPNGQSGAGKIKKETITEDGKIITITYSYDVYGNMNGKTTTTVSV